MDNSVFVYFCRWCVVVTQQVDTITVCRLAGVTCPGHEVADRDRTTRCSVLELAAGQAAVHRRCLLPTCVGRLSFADSLSLYLTVLFIYDWGVSTVYCTTCCTVNATAGRNDPSFFHRIFKNVFTSHNLFSAGHAVSDRWFALGCALVEFTTGRQWSDIFCSNPAAEFQVLRLYVLHRVELKSL